MSPLVPIPWQPSLLLTPDTLALLVAAGKRLGVNLFIYQSPDGPLDGAWRPLVRQEFLWRKAQSGGNTASNPYSGQRMHMRGGAFDLVRTDTAVQAACRSVGLIRDPSEPWHWNNPRMTSMPIITTNTTPAGNGGTPIKPEEDDMTPEQDRRLATVEAGIATLLAQRPRFELVRARGKAPVFFSTNRLTRVWVKNPQILTDYQFYLRSLGYVDTVAEVDSIESFGAVVGEVPAQ